jgi:hypothetical protein
MKEKCPKCKRLFSEGLIQPLFANGKYYPLCPICALEERNKTLGIPLDTPFTGEMALEMYEQALEEVKQNELRN